MHAVPQVLHSRDKVIAVLLPPYHVNHGLTQLQMLCLPLASIPTTYSKKTYKNWQVRGLHHIVPYPKDKVRRLRHLFGMLHLSVLLPEKWEPAPLGVQVRLFAANGARASSCGTQCQY